MITLYGINNCDTVKKAKKFLDENQIEFQFHDFKKQGLDKSLVDLWLTQIDWQTLLNKRGTTWRKLDDSIKDSVNEENVADLLVNYPSMIKRPVVNKEGEISVGFKADEWKIKF
ncbi:ArsC family reductase [Catenovulum sediminis]|uniref:ArsC family reductase n=1 Tax=Catenovulum sediminis TaxID=1740262 RepID=A0ABV1RM75_9ALTE|nr:ArsC family reductase [Catenovulum sediminis]